MGKSFHDFTVWRRSIALTTYIYEMTTAFPKSEIYGLTSQLRRAAVSIASNIAEGAGRGGKAEFRHFLTIARGSNCELLTQLIIASNLMLAPDEHVATAEAMSNEVGKMLNGLITSVSPGASK